MAGRRSSRAIALFARWTSSHRGPSPRWGELPQARSWALESNANRTRTGDVDGSRGDCYLLEGVRPGRFCFRSIRVCRLCFVVHGHDVGPLGIDHSTGTETAYDFVDCCAFGLERNCLRFGFQTGPERQIRPIPGLKPVTCIKPLKFEKVMDAGMGFPGRRDGPQLRLTV